MRSEEIYSSLKVSRPCLSDKMKFIFAKGKTRIFAYEAIKRLEKRTRDIDKIQLLIQKNSAYGKRASRRDRISKKPIEKFKRKEQKKGWQPPA